MKKRPLLWVFLLMMIGIVLIGQFGGFVIPQLPYEDGKEISLHGTVEEIQYTEGSQKIYLSKVVIPSESTYHRQVLVYLSQQTSLKIGYQVKITGEYQALQAASNPGQFDQKSYYEALGVGFLVKKAKVQVIAKNTDRFRQGLYELRNYFSWIYGEIAGEEEAGLFSAMILGEKSGLEEEVKERYQRGGISHILAISGLHISLVGMSLYRFLRKRKRSYGCSVLLSGSFMLCYGLMVGFGVSARRAIFMFLIYLGAEFFGETYDLLSSLSLAGIVILLGEPRLLFQSGFQLSFLSVGAVGGLYPVLRKRISWKGSFWDSLCLGFSVTILTLPCTLYWFYEFMPYSTFLNLVVIPLVPGVFLSGALGVLGGSLYLPLGEALAGPGVLILKVFDLLIEVTEGLPGSRLVLGRPEFYGIAGYYIVLGLGLFLGRRKGLSCVRGMTPAFLGIGVLVLVWKGPSYGEITFLDVGQGDGIFLKTPEGSNCLIDGGSSTVSQVGEYRIVPFLKSRGVGTLDALFLTHMDEDHISGARELLEGGEISVKILYLPEIPLDETAREITSLAEKVGTEVSYLSAGKRFEEEGFAMTCLYPEKGGNGEEKNENSLVLSAEISGRKVLLTGDLEGAGEEVLLAKGKLEQVDILKVAHHGSNGATSAEFLKQTGPKVSVISCGEENRYGHPAPELLERLEDSGSQVLLTMKNGAITMKIYKNSMKIHVMKTAL